MDDMESLRKKVVLRSQAREVVAKVYKRMKYEAENGVERLTDARWRTSKAVGVSVKTVSRILEEKATSNKTGTKMKSPHKHKNPRKRTKRDIDGFDKGVIRHTISNFHRQYKQFPTLKALKKVLTETINFDGCEETLRRILLDLGYEWKTTIHSRRALVEKHEMQILRYRYLQQLMIYKQKRRNIVFTGECYINTAQLQNKAWGIKTEPAGEKKTSKNIRIIIVHAGGMNGFVPNASLIYKAGSVDYQDSMNHENYKTWFTSQLLPNLPEKSVIIMDNAPCHNTLTENVPISNTDKGVMQEWLRSNNIHFDKSMKKVELYDIILKHKDNSRTYAIDEEAKKYNHDVLRLPPCHPDLNPIEKVWDVLKNYVANKNFNPTYTAILKTINERLAMIDLKDWINTCKHTEETEGRYWKDYQDEKEFIIHLGESDSEDDTSSFVGSEDE